MSLSVIRTRLCRKMGDRCRVICWNYLHFFLSLLLARMEQDKVLRSYRFMNSRSAGSDAPMIFQTRKLCVSCSNRVSHLPEELEGAGMGGQSPGNGLALPPTRCVTLSRPIPLSLCSSFPNCKMIL